MSIRNVFFFFQVVCLCLFFGASKAYAQVSPNSGTNSLSFFLSHRNLNFTNALYVHTDKNIYTNNEVIWFSTYLFSDNVKSYADHHVLCLALVQENTHEIAITNKYLIQNGRSSGGLTLPDTIAPGKYTLLAYTNVLNNAGQPKAIFSSRLTIKNTTQQDFHSSIALLDSTVKNGIVKVKIQISSNTEESRKQFKPMIEYQVGQGSKLNSVVKENELIINIPAYELNIVKPILHVVIKNKTESQYLELPLPSTQKRKIDLRFFPEGGLLAAGLPNNIGWECLNDKGELLPVSAILQKDNIAIDTIYNSMNGMGTFHLQPELNSKYSVKIEGGNYITKDTIIALPQQVNNLSSIQLTQAVCNDSLKLRLFSQNTPTVQLLLHNDAGEYCLFKIKKLQSGKLIILPLDSIKKGVSTFTLLDEQGRPLAERLFFAHYDQIISADIHTTKKNYRKRELVNLTIKLSDHYGRPVKGVFSIGVAQSTRLNTFSKNIDDEFYFTGLSGSGMEFESSYSNKENLENILLIHGWRKYTWLENNTKESDTLNKSALIAAQVKENGKLLNQPVTMAAINGGRIKLFNTNNDGSVMLTPDMLMSDNDKKIAFLLTGKQKSGFTMKVNDQFHSITSALASELIIENYNNFTDLSDSRQLALSGLDFTHTLATVTIKGNRGNGSFYESRNLGEPGTNDCGDYVDAAGELNYPYAKERFKPIKGKLYVHRTDYDNHRFKVDPAWYSGCDVEENKAVLLTIDGIYSKKEFYGVNPNSIEEQFTSTLFWNPEVITNVEGTATLQFMTGDIEGSFTALIEGTTANNVVSGKTTFSVQ